MFLAELLILAYLEIFKEAQLSFCMIWGISIMETKEVIEHALSQSFAESARTSKKKGFNTFAHYVLDKGRFIYVVAVTFPQLGKNS